MSKLIKNWEELAKVPPNDRYQIVVDLDTPDEDSDFLCNCEGMMKDSEFFKHHVYLSTHTFYGSNYKHSTKILQDHGFDIEIDNWDKER